jgi:hypothetical protein
MRLGFDAKDFYASVGAGLLIFGLYRIWPPLGIIALGLLFLKVASIKTKSP